MAKYRILSIDGSGIYGVITAVLLHKLNLIPSLTGWMADIDLIAGTSSGGLVALGLAVGRDPQEIRSLYETQSDVVFARVLYKKLLDPGGWNWAMWEATNLAQILKTVVGDQLTLAQLGKYVLITAFDLDYTDPDDPTIRKWKPKLFHNMPIPVSEGGNDGAKEVYKVGLYTCLAPTYWPSEDGFIDGGVYAPNPSMCALAQSQDHRLPTRPPLSDIVLFSLGTESRNYLEGDMLDWGKLRWAKYLPFLMLHGVTGIADYQCQQFLGKEGYHRLAPPLTQGWPSDDLSNMPDMIQFAETFDISETVQWLETHWL